MESNEVQEDWPLLEDSLRYAPYHFLYLNAQCFFKFSIKPFSLFTFDWHRIERFNVFYFDHGNLDFAIIPQPISRIFQIRNEPRFESFRRWNSKAIFYKKIQIQSAEFLFLDPKFNLLSSVNFMPEI